ncbi:MAG: GNAT family acetyltransferase [Betaproteobacteria bacterium]|nr:GNAT family acetyltransferase [Betaproteobacteria bacterium]
MVKNVTKYGVVDVLHDIECRLINKFVQFQILKGMTVQLEDVTDPGLFEARGFEGRFVGWDELAKFAHDGLHDFSIDFLRQAHMRGDRCYALFEGEALAAYGWYSSLSTPIDDHFLLHFDPAWTYMYKGYTVPAYRGKRLHAAGMCRALRALTGQGKKGLISWVFSNNFASLHSVARMGYRIFGEAYLLRSGSRSFTYASRACRDYGFWVEARASAFGENTKKGWSHP